MRRKLSTLLLMTFCAPLLWAQATGGFVVEHWDSTTGSSPMRVTDRTTLGGMVGLPANIAVTVHPDRRKHRAEVKVVPLGVQFVDPSSQPGTPDSYQGYVQYRLDNGAPVSTSASQWTFANLPPGHHTITVALLGADGKPMVGEKVFQFNMPKR